jgi:hypothetical protein
MRHPDDTVTAELPGIKTATVPKKKGRPAVYASRAEKQAAYRARHQVKPLTVEIPADLHAEFEAWLKFKDKKKSAVIAHLIRSQLLRKR